MTSYISNEVFFVASLSDVINNLARPQDGCEHPAKRVKVGPAMTRSIARSGLSKRGRASCLSELPMVPLDILFEIFSHLHPSDLLSLSRVNKAFRFQLLSGGSSSLWNTCFRLCSAPTTPVDMSPASWANFLLSLGYLEKDVNQLRLHSEVRMDKRMSDRVWMRVEPLLLSKVNEARDRRLVLEGGEDYKLRRQRVIANLADFSNLLKISPILLAHSPSGTRSLCEDQALASALAQNSGPNDPSVRSRFLEAIKILRPELETRKLERARHLRSLLTDVSEGLTDDGAIALATSVYKCSDCRLLTSGPHMLAHDCDRGQKPGTFRPQPSDRGRETVMTLLQLLGLGEGTMALDLDRRNDKFVCIQCSRRSFIQGGKGVLGRCVRDWRSCIAHAISSKHERWNKCSPNWRVVTPTETAGLIWEESSTAQAYGCLHCPTQIDPNRSTVQWYTKLGEVMEHVQIVHGMNNPLEGCDFFHDFRTRRVGRKARNTMPPRVDG